MLIFGIRDGTWEVTGFPDSAVQIKRDAVANSIYDACEPPIAARTETVRINERNIIIVTVGPGSGKPYYIRRQGLIDGTYIRIGSETRHASFEAVQELILEGSNRSYDQLIREEEEMSEEDLHALCRRLTEHAQLRSGGEQIRPLTVNQLLSWKLLRRSSEGRLYPSNGLLLLQGRSESFPYAYVQCAVFRGSDRSTFTDRKEIHGPADQQVEDATAFVLEHIHLDSRIDGPQRKDFYELPVASIREMIAKAVVHRSYIQYGCVQVALFDDRLEVTSPGRLSAELSLQELQEGHSRIRNEGLAQVFAYLHLIEKWGTGIPRIYRETREYGLPEPRITAQTARFRMEMFRRPFETDFYGVIDPAARGSADRDAEPFSDRRPDAEKEQNEDITGLGALSVRHDISVDEAQQLLLDILVRDETEAGETRITIASLSKTLGWTSRKVQYQLEKLVRLGLVERVGARRNGKWMLTRKFHEHSTGIS